MAPAPTDGKKRKKPPTFQHLPDNRAKKLKRSWVETQKIKSQWKQQKRKEGLVITRKPSIDGLRTEEHPHEETADPNDSGSVSSASDESAGGDQSSDEDTSSPQPKATTSSSGRKHDKGAEKPEKPSVRELGKQAYSRSALHTYRSHSMSNRSEAPASRGRGQGRGRGNAGRFGRGRGQPDMRLRMNAMLAKIERGLT